MTTAFESAAEALFTESRNLLLSAHTFPEINLLRNQFYQQLERLIGDYNGRTIDRSVWQLNAEICAQLKTDFIELARQHLHFRRSANGR